MEFLVIGRKYLQMFPKEIQKKSQLVNMPLKSLKLFSSASSKPPPTKATWSAISSAVAAQQRPSPSAWAEDGLPATWASLPHS